MIQKPGPHSPRPRFQTLQLNKIWKNNRVHDDGSDAVSRLCITQRSSLRLCVVEFSSEFTAEAQRLQSYAEKQTQTAPLPTVTVMLGSRVASGIDSRLSGPAFIRLEQAARLVEYRYS